MSDGWETRRRRKPGNDWGVIQLGAPGLVEQIEVDTAFYKGNYPDRCSIQAACVSGGTERSTTTQSMFWPTLLPEQPLRMDAVHLFADEIVGLGPVTHIRFNIIPDGGVSRLRLWGRIAGECPDQGVNYGRGVWHHPLLALGGSCDFLVIDRSGPRHNCDEIELAPPALVPHGL